ncbi:MAG TPA: hypothetical protein VF940_25445, partial [Streptosporangiaceae bacterium]
MNKLLSELRTFSNYCNAEGTFVPRRLFETFMSVEQATRRREAAHARHRAGHIPPGNLPRAHPPAAPPAGQG